MTLAEPLLPQHRRDHRLGIREAFENRIGAGPAEFARR